MQWSDVQPKAPDVDGQMCLDGSRIEKPAKPKRAIKTSGPIRQMHACQDGTYRYNDTNEIAPICEWPS